MRSLVGKILAYDRIVIQGHDFPDADALASGFALHAFLSAQGKPPRFIYSGPAPIKKPNLLKMVADLGIPAEYDPAPAPVDGLLITVDAQYGAGNIAKIPAAAVAVLDHHLQETPLPPLHDLRPALGSCATLVWDILTANGFRPEGRLATALYYGLFCDTGGNIQHPLDVRMQRGLAPDQETIKNLLHSNLSLPDLTLASQALSSGLKFFPGGRFALIEVPPCDPNLLGFIADTALQVDAIDVAVSFSPLAGAFVKFSVRTVSAALNAAHLAVWLAGKFGNGGGGDRRAGGRLKAPELQALFGAGNLTAFFSQGLEGFLKTHRLKKAIGLASPGDAHKE